MRSEDLVKELYEPGVLAARERFETDSVVRMLLDPVIEPALFEHFLLQHCCLEGRLAEPGEQWLRRASERCAAQGWEGVGQALAARADHEARHAPRLLEGARRLVHAWNVRYLPRLEVEVLLIQPLPPSAREHERLHEDTLSQPLPVGEVALVLEAEELALAWGRPLLVQARRVLGADAPERLRFLRERVEAAEQQCAQYRRLIAEVLAELPQAASQLSELGSRAVDTSARLIHDCLLTAAAALRPTLSRPAAAG